MKRDDDDQKKLGLYDFVNAIQQDQSMEFFDNLNDTNKKAYRYSRYMIHRALSMNVVYSPIVNFIQKFSSIPDRLHYMFLANIIPRKKQYSKYIKGSKETKYEKWLIDLIAKHFNISKKESIDYLEIYYAHDKEELKNICQMYGIEPKQIKTLKL